MVSDTCGKSSLGPLNQARVRTEKLEAKPWPMYKYQAKSISKPTVPKPFRFRTKERSDLRATNAEKNLKQIKGKVDSQRIERLPNPSETVGSDLEKESGACVSMDAIPSATRIWANPLFASKPEETIMRGIPELEVEVQTLQTELTTLSAHLTLLQRDRACMIGEIFELKLRLQNMEQQVHLQRDEFLGLHNALSERVEHLELLKSTELCSDISNDIGRNLELLKSTELCSDISNDIGRQPVAAAANSLSAATLVRADSQRTSIDPLNFLSLESYGGISLTEDGRGDFEFIMDSAINCSFDGSLVPEACVTPASISYMVSDEPREKEDLGYWEKWCTIDRMDQCCMRDRFDPFDELPVSYLINEPADEGKESRLQEEDIVYWKKPYIEPLDELTRMNEALDEAFGPRQDECRGYWEKPYICEPLDEGYQSNPEKEDPGNYLENVYTIDPIWEVICKDYPEGRVIKEYLAKPGLSEHTIRLCGQMLCRIASNSNLSDLLTLFNAEEAALFDIIVDHYLNSFFPDLFSSLT